MSDFIKSPAPDVAWPEVQALLRQWITKGLAELDAHRLLKAWNPTKAPKTSAMRDVERNRSFNWKRRRDGLKWAAIVFRKDVRTIRRWCEEEFFREAWQTPGGHWRIAPDHVDEMFKYFPEGGGERKTRTIFGTREWKQFRRKIAPVLFRILPELLLLEDILRDICAVALMENVEEPSSEKFELLRKHLNGKCDVGYLMLRNLARRLFLKAPDSRLTYRDLAHAIGKSPATLYRRFGKVNINSAIKAAETPLQKRDQDENKNESEWDEIKEMFQDVQTCSRDTWSTRRNVSAFS